MPAWLVWTPLREMGAGDLAVPKKIKKMGEMFYGLTARVSEALDAGVGDVTLTAGGAISQTATGTINAALLTTTSATGTTRGMASS